MHINKLTFFCSTLLLIIFSTDLLLAQTPLDSLEEVEHVDTVRVKKKIIVNKIVYAPMLKKENIFFIGLNAGTFGDKSYYSSCESCQTYANKVHEATSYAFSYNYGLNVAYSPRKLYFSLGVSGSHYRSNFHYVDSSGTTHNAINELRFAGVDFSGGYWFRKQNTGFSYMLLGGVSYGWLYKVSGSTLSQKNSDKVVDLKNEIDFYPTPISINAAIRILYPIARKFNVHADIFYAYDTKTIIKTAQFVQQRNLYGLKLGFIYTFK